MTFFSLFLCFHFLPCRFLLSLFFLSFPSYFSSHQHRKLRGAFCYLGTGEKRSRLELSVNENKCERAGRVTKAMRRSTRTTRREYHTTSTHTIITRASIVFCSGFLNVAVVQQFTCVTDFCIAGRRNVYPSWGTTSSWDFRLSGRGVVTALQHVKLLRKVGRSLLFVLVFFVRLLLIHCMPAGRHSDSTLRSSRVRLCSRLPCGSCGAGSPTAVVCSRELVSCGNGGTLCCSYLDTRGHVSPVCT